MLRDTGLPHHPDNVVETLSKKDLIAKFDAALDDVAHDRSSSRELILVYRGEREKFSSHSALAPIGSCSEHELEEALQDFLLTHTGLTQKDLLDIGVKDPDHRKIEDHYNKLETTFGLKEQNTGIGLTISLSERGIESATWSIKRTDVSTSIIRRAISKLIPIFSR